MEPRPQRPRAQSGHQQPARQQAVPQQDPRAPQGDYPIGVDPTAFVAPPRTEYDYSPLDLAPPGQRRRRQLVAAAVGGLSVLLLGAIIFFAYLLLNEDDPPSENDDLLAAQTQVANDAATVAANQTMVAQAADEQTAQAGGGEEEGETPTEESAATEEPEATEPAGAGEETAAPEETPSANGEGEGDGAGEETPAAPDLSGNASLDEEGLLALLPGQEQVPADLTTVVDTTRTQEQVVESLGGGRPAESSLAEWGWSGNVERSFENPDPENADPASTTYLSVSIHGFDGPESAEAALPFYAEILVASGSGYTEIDAPDIGDGTQMFSVNDANGGTWITLYVRDGSVMYRIFAVSPGGDPTEDVIAVANELVGS
jgi:hypothetical protein